MSLIRHISLLLPLLLCFNFGFSQVNSKDTGLIYHVDYHGYTPNNDDKTLFWLTQNEIPQTRFIVEHFCWNRWVRKSVVASSSNPGKHKYKLKVLPHSGLNIFRVVLVNDSNVRLASSIELHAVLNNTIVPKVTFTDKKGSREIKFSSETDYEILDSGGQMVKEGRGTSVSYSDLDEGAYSLNFDNSTTTLRRKK